MNNFQCEICGRNMGDIDEPICHECEVRELDAIEASEAADRHARIIAERERIMGAIPSRFTDPAYAKQERKVARVERSIRRALPRVSEASDWQSGPGTEPRRYPACDITHSAGVLERESPLFFGTGENPVLF